MYPQQHNIMKEFIKDLEDLLHSTPYMGVDILPLVEKYTEGKTQDEKSSIRITIQGLLNQYKQSGLIEGNDFHAQLAWQRPTHIEGLQEDPIIIRSTIKFEEQYFKKHTTPPTPQHFEFNNSPNAVVAGRDVNMRDNKPDEESKESKELVKEQLKDIPVNAKDRRLTLIWTIVLVLATIVGLWLTLFHKG